MKVPGMRSVVFTQRDARNARNATRRFCFCMRRRTLRHLRQLHLLRFFSVRTFLCSLRSSRTCLLIFVASLASKSMQGDCVALRGVACVGMETRLNYARQSVVCTCPLP